jgi:hypothetical protein
MAEDDGNPSAEKPYAFSEAHDLIKRLTVKEGLPTVEVGKGVLVAAISILGSHCMGRTLPRCSMRLRTTTPPDTLNSPLGCRGLAARSPCKVRDLNRSPPRHRLRPASGRCQIPVGESLRPYRTPPCAMPAHQVHARTREMTCFRIQRRRSGVSRAPIRTHRSSPRPLAD